MRIAVFIASILEIIAWLFRLPALFRGDLSGPFSPGYVALLIVEFALYPALAVAAFILAYRRRWLRLAAVLAAVEPAIFFLGVIVFGLGAAK